MQKTSQVPKKVKLEASKLLGFRLACGNGEVVGIDARTSARIGGKEGVKGPPPTPV